VEKQKTQQKKQPIKNHNQLTMILEPVMPGLDFFVVSIRDPGLSGKFSRRLSPDSVYGRFLFITRAKELKWRGAGR